MALSVSGFRLRYVSLETVFFYFFWSWSVRAQQAGSGAGGLHCLPASTVWQHLVIADDRSIIKYAISF